jgi:hypothetical protein|tara:strand:+ start:460 stop:1134 length:675 start_codon:yes stop_codon:yes gene_type:complete
MIIIDFTDQIIAEKENKTLNKPFRTPKGPKKFSVYVKNEKGNIVKVNFGDPNMEIKRDDPARRKSFRARHNCDNPGPKWKARYWSCRQWRAGKKVEGSHPGYDWDGETIFDHEDLLAINPKLAFAEEIEAKPTPEDYMFNNPGEATKKAKEMGLDGIHSHKDGDKTIFMPGPSHKALMDKIESDASIWENIRKKRERIKKGSGEKMRKKGDKGAPTEKQIKKAQ